MTSHVAPIALVATLAAAGALAFATLGRPSLPDAVGLCRPAHLPVQLATTSKIDQADPHKATLASTATRRETTLRPARRAVASVAEAAEGSAAERDCAARTIVAWARSDALTDMRGKDANLTRGRLGAEALVAAVRLDERGAFAPHQRRRVATWANELATSTTAFFARGAGPKSKINNHRQWAGLLVGAAGRLTGDPAHATWAREAAELALCSVTPDGFLPVEMTRGRRAWRYHRYALRPILALRRLGVWDGAADPCGSALPHLRTVAADPSPIGFATGLLQDGPATESSFGPSLRLNRIARAGM